MIKQLIIRDFKSIRSLDLKLEEATVLIGRSGAGKSNIVRALRFLRNYLIHADQAANYEGSWASIVPMGLKQPRTSISITFALPGEEQDYNFQIAFTVPAHQGEFMGGMWLESERLSLGGHLLFHRVRDTKGIWNWPKAPDVLPIPQQVDAPMLGSFPSLEKVVFAYAALSSGIGFYHFPSSVLASDNQPDQDAQFLTQIPGLNDSARNYKEIMRRITQDFHNPNLRKSLLASLRHVNGSVTSVELDSLTNPSRALVGHSAGEKTFALSLQQESDGFRRFYAHLLALYQTPAKLTLIFEEPENAIFPGALSLLAEEFVAAPKENRGQVILTTHSPSLLNSFGVETLRVVEMDNGETRVGPIAKEQREAVQNHLLTTGELLTIEEPRLERAQQAA